VGSQGSALLETYAFTLNSGSIYAVSNNPNDTSNELCVLPGIPSSLVMDPAGRYAYAILNSSPSCSGSVTGILAFKINSDGTTTAVGSPVSFNMETVTPCLPPLPPPNPPLCRLSSSTEQVPVVPGMMVMDPAGKFLFVADRATSDTSSPPLPVPGAVSVFAIASGGSLTEVTGSPFFTSSFPTTPLQPALDIVSVAPTPTVFPAIGLNGVQNAACSDVANPPPTLQYLYAVDGLGNQVFEFSVNTTTGVLTNPSTNKFGEPSFATDPTPAGVAVDPCNRFVYVSDSLTDKVSAYSICNDSATSQPGACMKIGYPGALVPVAGSPFPLAGSTNLPGPLVVDPYGKYVYVLGTLSNTINPMQITQISGSLAATRQAPVATGIGPVSIVIRPDDSWMFVANYGSPAVGGNTVSQYAITPETGELSAQPAIPTDNYPWGVAVK